MAQDKTNPFVLPGFGQSDDTAGNPLLAGLDMMRQAWQNLAGANPLETPAMPSLSPDDLDRRIRELQTVQNWLQLNATMLASTIQGLEIQRSTLQTLQSFAGGGFPGMAAAPAGPAASVASAKPAAAAEAAGTQDSSQVYAQAASDWWNLVQQQFNQLRDATAASFDQMAAAADTAAVAPAATAKAAPKASARPAKPAARKTTAGNKATAGKAAASKTAAKSTASPKKRST